MPDFKNAKVGDKIWDNWTGYYREIYCVTNTYIALLDNSVLRLNGTDYDIQTSYNPPRYFWSKPEINDPPKPKRKVRVKRWYNFGKIEYDNRPYLVGACNGYKDEKEAIKNGENSVDYFYSVPIEFEVEE